MKIIVAIAISIMYIKSFILLRMYVKSFVQWKSDWEVYGKRTTT